MRYIRNFDEDKPYYRVCFWDIALDPDVPQEMLDDIFGMDSSTQERVLLDADTPEILFDNLSQFDLSIQEKVLANNKLSESQLEQYIGFFYSTFEGINISKEISDTSSNYTGEEIENIRSINDILTGASSSLPEHILKVARRKRTNFNVVS